MSNYGSFNPSAVAKLVLGAVFFTLFGCGESSVPEKSASKKSVVKKIEKQKKRDVILCFGNSLTEGYGLNSEESYPNLLQNKLDSFGYDYEVVNAGLSGETTAGGRGRLNWVLKNKVNIFILELGANDGLRGIPLKTTNDNLKDIIDTVKATKYQNQEKAFRVVTTEKNDVGKRESIQQALSAHAGLDVCFKAIL